MDHVAQLPFDYGDGAPPGIFDYPLESDESEFESDVRDEEPFKPCGSFPRAVWAEGAPLSEPLWMLLGPMPRLPEPPLFGFDDEEALLVWAECTPEERAFWRTCAEKSTAPTPAAQCADADEMLAEWRRRFGP